MAFVFFLTFPPPTAFPAAESFHFSLPEKPKHNNVPQIHHIGMPLQNVNLNYYVVSVKSTDQQLIWVTNLESSSPWRA